MKKITLFFMCLLLGGALWAQNIQVSGVVTDASDGQPIPGAVVVVVGTKATALADDNGRYTISAPANASLEFSSMNMKILNVSIGGRSVINVTMEASVVQLEEVVVTAMGISREKKSIGYATQEVKADQLVQTRQTDLNNALAGKIAGARFFGASGATFDAGKMILRGTSTLSAGGNEPIYIVDNVITNVNTVNLDDVESVNVLKGPAATAIYGSRGGNGAVIITTKKGTIGKTQFDFSQTTTFENVYMHTKYQNQYGGGHLGADGDLETFNYNPSIHPSYLQVLDGAQYYDMGTDESWGPKLDGRSYAPWYAWDPSHPKFGQLSTWSPQSKDNLKELYNTGITNTTNIAFSKSTQGFSTRVSFSNVSRTGVTENSDAVRRYFSINANMQLTDRLKMSVDYKYTYRKNHNAAVEGYGGTANANYTFMQWYNATHI